MSDAPARKADSVQILQNMAQDHLKAGRLDEALSCMASACEQRPENAAYKFFYARLLHKSGQTDKAFFHVVRAINLDTANIAYKNTFALWADGMSFSTVGTPFKQAVISCLRDDRVNRTLLQDSWLSLVMADTDYRDLISFNEKNDVTFMADPFLLAGLPVFFSSHPVLEKSLTNLRRHIMAGSDGRRDMPAAFAAALALHCFQNEFVFSCTDEERNQIDQWRAQIEQCKKMSEDDLRKAVIYGCYRPLHSLKNAPALCAALARHDCPYHNELAVRQISEPLEEQEIAQTIEAITPIRNQTSQAVQSQYEQSPYPRWFDIPRQAEKKDSHHQEERYQFLDAGCGTGQSPLTTALRWQESADITAIDLSRASLSYGQRIAARLGIRNLKFYQADILELGCWDQRFDVIISGGVIHHMKEPEKGAAMLRDLLKPNGAMLIGLYSESGRRDVVAGRALIAQKGWDSTPEDIRKFRAHVFAAADDDPVKPLQNRYDFYGLSNCRDLVFHVMEHRYDCLRIKEMLDNLDLKFLGFQALSPAINHAFSQMFPEAKAVTDLTAWAAFETAHPQAFRQLYPVWCCRKDEQPDKTMPLWAQR